MSSCIRSNGTQQVEMRQVSVYTAYGACRQGILVSTNMLLKEVSLLGITPPHYTAVISTSPHFVPAPSIRRLHCTPANPEWRLKYESSSPVVCMYVCMYVCMSMSMHIYMQVCTYGYSSWCKRRSHAIKARISCMCVSTAQTDRVNQVSSQEANQ
jgi:hypothetical protein